jgi:Flp pilus assembly pilin Flp
MTYLKRTPQHGSRLAIWSRLSIQEPPLAPSIRRQAHGDSRAVLDRLSTGWIHHELVHDQRVHAKLTHDESTRTEIYREFVDDARGLASVEYVIILSVVTLGATFAVLHLGLPLVDSFAWQTAILGQPIP